MCWFSDENYKTNNIKTCMVLYSAEDGESFGWKAASSKMPTEDDFK